MTQLIAEAEPSFPNIRMIKVTQQQKNISPFIWANPGVHASQTCTNETRE